LQDIGKVLLQHAGYFFLSLGFHGRKIHTILRKLVLQRHIVRKIEHIGIAVSDLQASNALFEKLLGTASYKEEEVPSEGVRTSFFRMGATKVELLQATSDASAIAKFIEKKGEGVHHIAFDVEDIEAEVGRLKAEGFEVLNETPRKGADNKLVVFVHPKSCNGVLIELCQEAR
jgi:methylmalonyl-CoA/ethylmalonyl-CoA epimerase